MSVPFVLCVCATNALLYLMLKRIIIIADKAYNAHKNRHKIVIYEICCWTTSCSSEGFDKAKIVRRGETKPKKKSNHNKFPNLFVLHSFSPPRAMHFRREEREIGMLVVVVKNSWT